MELHVQSVINLLQLKTTNNLLELSKITLLYFNFIHTCHNNRRLQKPKQTNGHFLKHSVVKAVRYTAFWMS